MANLFCASVLFECACDTDHESEAKCIIYKINIKGIQLHQMYCSFLPSFISRPFEERYLWNILTSCCICPSCMWFCALVQQSRIILLNWKCLMEHILGFIKSQLEWP